MRVEIYRLTGEPVAIEVNEGATVKDVFSHPESGKAIHQPGSLLQAANEAYGSVEGLGTLRVNGAAATLDSLVQAGATILLIPKVEGGCA